MGWFPALRIWIPLMFKRVLSCRPRFPGSDPIILLSIILFWHWRIPFPLIWIQDAGMMTEGTVPVPPYRPCAERWWRSTCSGVIASGKPQRRGCNPPERMLLIEHCYRVNILKKKSPEPRAPDKKRDATGFLWRGEKPDLKKLFCWFACFEFDKDRSYCFCGYWSSHKNRELPAIVDVSHLETDNQSKAEAGDTY